MTDQLLKDAFERIADRAQPVPGLADKAMRRASRRRAARLSVTVAAVAAAGAVAAPFALFGGAGGPEGPRPADGAGELPVNSPAEREVVRACLRGGPPVGMMSEPRPRYGGPADHRLLVDIRMGAETVAMVGSGQGFVLCARRAGQNVEPPMFRPWPDLTSGGLWSFNGEARIDVVSSLPKVDGDGRGFSSSHGLHHVVAGRVKPDVAKVVVTWDRGRTALATVRNGFFIARVDSEIVPVKGGSKGDLPGAMEDREERVRKVEAFSAEGRSLYLWSAGRTKGVRGFDPNDCASTRDVQLKSLCEGLPERP
jgi:hypothetical protein